MWVTVIATNMKVMDGYCKPVLSSLSLSLSLSLHLSSISLPLSPSLSLRSLTQIKVEIPWPLVLRLQALAESGTVREVCLTNPRGHML